MIKKLNGLVITYCYPPYNSPESFITFKFLDALSKEINLTLVKPEIEKKNINFKFSQNIKIKEINVRIPPLINFLLNLKRLPLRPDRFLLYYPMFKNTLSKINIPKFDFVMTRSQFHSVHLLGLFLKKKYNIQWLASFSDPWYDNPVQKKVPFFDNVSFFLQKKVFEKTDLNMFPLEELMTHFNNQIKKDIKKNSLIVPHSIKKIKFGDNKRSNTIRFFGKIYAGRKIKNALIALTNIIELYKNIDVEFFVDNDFFISQKPLIEEFKKIKFIRYLNYEDYLKKLNQSLVLLLIDLDEDYGKLFFQSKMVDYIQSLRPILHIGKSETYNKKLVLESNGMSCLNNPINIFRTLEKLIQSEKKYKPNNKLLSLFNSNNIAQKVIKKIK